MDLDALKRGVIGAGAVTAPGASPNSTGANAFAQAAIQHIQALSGISQRGAASKFAGGALYGGVNQQAATDQANEQAAHDAAVADAKQKAADAAQAAKDLADPNKYQRVPNKSGGYDFFAPDGTKINAQDYAQIKGQHVTDAVKGSQNTTDQAFLQDYKEVQALGDASQQGGSALQDYFKKNPDIKKQLDSEGIKTYSDVVKNFRSSYPQYFPQQSVNDIGNGRANNQQLGTGGGNLVDKLKGLLSGIF